MRACVLLLLLLLCRCAYVIKICYLEHFSLQVIRENGPVLRPTRQILELWTDHHIRLMTPRVVAHFVLDERIRRLGYVCFNAPLRPGRDWTDTVIIYLYRVRSRRRGVRIPAGEFGRFYLNRPVAIRHMEVTDFPHLVTDVTPIE